MQFRRIIARVSIICNTIIAAISTATPVGSGVTSSGFLGGTPRPALLSGAIRSVPTLVEKVLWILGGKHLSFGISSLSCTRAKSTTYVYPMDTRIIERAGRPWEVAQAALSPARQTAPQKDCSDPRAVKIRADDLYFYLERNEHIWL